MRATTRLTGGLAVLTAGLALTACGTTTTTEAHDDAKLSNCRTSSLKWTLVLLGKERGGSRGEARLTAVNKGPDTCVFNGYPGIEIHNGKAESIDGAGHGHPASFSLAAKATVTVDVHYTPRGTKGAGDWCVRQGEAVLWAPHDSDRTVVPVLDRHRKTTVIDACGETLSLAPPHHAPAGN
ncbi:DUF4232 domain-containing protein [Streptomyces sp. NPDC001410]|uniref:DUF4232 domain-containing protein n=1 Tax=Streptomyces sp. NPDC001410 TaxID=3364574 RepID=UPI0036AFAE42